MKLDPTTGSHAFSEAEVEALNGPSVFPPVDVDWRRTPTVRGYIVSTMTFAPSSERTAEPLAYSEPVPKPRIVVKTEDGLRQAIWQQPGLEALFRAEVGTPFVVTRTPAGFDVTLGKAERELDAEAETAALVARAEALYGRKTPDTNSNETLHRR
jgi:hypothetical protein